MGKNTFRSETMSEGVARQRLQLLMNHIRPGDEPGEKLAQEIAALRAIVGPSELPTKPIYGHSQLRKKAGRDLNS